MVRYIIPHSLPGERERLEMFASMLDTNLFFRLGEIGVKPGWKCLEAGAGIGTVSQWLSEQVGPKGEVTVSDLDTKFINELAGGNLKVRQLDLQTDFLGEGYDLIVTRNCLHHLPMRYDIISRMAEALNPGGWLVLEEPDFYPVHTTLNSAVQSFWTGFLEWSENRSVDYKIGRRLGPWLSEQGLVDISVNGDTKTFQGGSDLSKFWIQTYTELKSQLLSTGFLSEEVFDAAMAHFSDPKAWVTQCSFVIGAGKKRSS
ncbi:MAG: class I SAM-dependent methyltransferase [Verrucomicrobiota bacterium]